MSHDDGDFPSAPLVLDVLRSGREERRAHFDSLDQKAGLALGFAGLLVTLSNDIVQPWRFLGASASIVAAGLALWSFWPRKVPVLDNARKYLAAPEHQTRMALVDALHEMDGLTDRLSETKARRLKCRSGRSPQPCCCSESASTRTNEETAMATPDPKNPAPYEPPPVPPAQPDEDLIGYFERGRSARARDRERDKK